MKFPCMLHNKIVELKKGGCVSGYSCSIANMTKAECQICNQMHGYLLLRLCDRQNCSLRFIKESEDWEDCDRKCPKCGGDLEVHKWTALSGSLYYRCKSCDYEEAE